MPLQNDLKSDARELVAWARERGLGLDDVAVVSIDTRSAAWIRVREKTPWLHSRVPSPMPVAMLMVRRNDARNLVEDPAGDAYYADQHVTLDSRGLVPLILIDDGAS
jgi:hypothetical protein